MPILYIPFIYLYTHLESSVEFYLLKAFEIDFHFVYSNTLEHIIYRHTCNIVAGYYDWKNFDKFFLFIRKLHLLYTLMLCSR